MRFAAMFVVLMPLVGCAQYDAAREANLSAAAQERVASDDASCRPAGAPGSPAYEDCRRRLANQHANETHRQEELANRMVNESFIRPRGQ